MKILFALFVAVRSFALTIEFIGPCSPNALLSTKIQVQEEVSVGQATVETLSEFSIPFRGSINHLESAFNTPYGLDAMEVLSDTDMRSHGWCFDINGQTSGFYPGDVFVSDDDHISWYFCYVSYKSGVWDDKHQKTYKIKPAQFCD